MSPIRMKPTLEQRQLYGKQPRKFSTKVAAVAFQKTLTKLGFETYEEYLKSDLWRSIRSDAYMSRGRFCVICSDPAECIHHASYRRDVMDGSDIKPLYPLCHKCHKRIHKKATLTAANKALFKQMGKKPKSKSSDNGPFLEFWSAYPRKVAKIAAKSAWTKAVKRIEDEQEITTEEARRNLLEITKVFAKSKVGKAGKYCPHPTTWLNQGRYDDDPEEWNDSPREKPYRPPTAAEAERHRF